MWIFLRRERWCVFTLKEIIFIYFVSIQTYNKQMPKKHKIQKDLVTENIHFQIYERFKELSNQPHDHKNPVINHVYRCIYLVGLAKFWCFLYFKTKKKKRKDQSSYFYLLLFNLFSNLWAKSTESKIQPDLIRLCALAEAFRRVILIPHSN